MDKTKYKWIFEPEVEEYAFVFIFSRCDSVRYLSEYDYGYIGDISELQGTELAPLIPALIKCYEGQSYGMRGKIYAFALTEEVKAIVRRNCLYELSHEDVKLQNGSLYSGEKSMFTCCSHEGMSDYDKEFERELAEVCCDAIDKSSKYAFAAAVFDDLPAPFNKSDRALTKALSRLSSIGEYVTEEWQACIRGCPDFPCTYKKYLKLARIFLSPDLNAELQRYSSFKALHPQGYPRSTSEIEKWLDVKGFDQSPLYERIRDELNYLHYVADKRGRTTRLDRGDAGPTIIINS